MRPPGLSAHRVLMVFAGCAVVPLSHGGAQTAQYAVVIRPLAAASTTIADTGTRTFQGAPYRVELGTVTDSAGCGYAIIAAGSILLSLTDDGYGELVGTASGPMNIGVTLTKPSPLPGASCTAGPYSVQTLSGDISGSYSDLSAGAADPSGFASWALTGDRIASLLIGTLRITVIVPDPSNVGNILELPTYVLTGYRMLLVSTSARAGSLQLHGKQIKK
jgi:hypothetical protein